MGQQLELYFIINQKKMTENNYPIIFHITTQPDFDQAKKQGFYTHPSYKSEGFIHLSRDIQMKRTLNTYFKNVNELLILVVQADKVDSKVLKYEESVPGLPSFPHIYDNIPLEAIIDTLEINKKEGEEWDFNAPEKYQS